MFVDFDGMRGYRELLIVISKHSNFNEISRKGIKLSEC